MSKSKPKYILPRYKWKFPRQIEREYAATLRAVAIALHTATQSRLPILNSLLRSRQDETDSEYVLRLILEAYAATMATDKALQKAARIAEQVRGFNQGEFYATLRSALKVDIFLPDPDLRGLVNEWTAENTRLIKSIPDEYFGKLQGIVSRGFQEGAMTNDIADQIQDLYNVTSSRAQLIAVDQVGSLNGLITMQRQTNAGISFYQWSTSKDVRVRPAHADREGRYYAWKTRDAGGTFAGKTIQQPPNDGPPGVPIRCRCVALPVVNTEALAPYLR